MKSDSIVVPSAIVGFNSTKGLTPAGKKKIVDLKSDSILVPSETVGLTSNDALFGAFCNCGV